LSNNNTKRCLVHIINDYKLGIRATHEVKPLRNHINEVRGKRQKGRKRKKKENNKNKKIFCNSICNKCKLIGYKPGLEKIVIIFKNPLIWKEGECEERV
jgi:hypothetical protein